MLGLVDKNYRQQKYLQKQGWTFEQSAVYCYRQQFGLDVQCSALFLTSTKYFQMCICTGLDVQ